MGNYIMLDGKKFEIGAELAEMLAQAVKKEPEKRSPFDRQAGGDRYYYIEATGEVTAEEIYDLELFGVANYCADEELMEQRALHETLNRLLWRYSEQHGGDLEWGPIEMDHYSICRDTLNDRWTILVSATTKYPGVVYFKDKKTAQKAVEEIVEPFMRGHPEFRW